MSRVKYVVFSCYLYLILKMFFQLYFSYLLIIMSTTKLIYTYSLCLYNIGVLSSIKGVLFKCFGFQCVKTIYLFFYLDKNVFIFYLYLDTFLSCYLYLYLDCCRQHWFLNLIRLAGFLFCEFRHRLNIH